MEHPPVEAMKEIIQRTGNGVCSGLKSPVCVTDLNLPADYQKALDWRDCFLFDSRPTADVITVFRKHNNFWFLSSCKHWFTDGTFKTTHPLFNQVYIIHGLIYRTVQLLVYALVPNKRKSLYTTLLETLKMLEPNLISQTIMIAFAPVMLNLFESAFSGVEKKRFSFSYFIYKKIEEHVYLLRK